jgi:Rad3-related DNA helicase
MEARFEANAAPVAVLNTAYYLAELNGPGRFRKRGLTVFDECDTLEGYLMGWAQVTISRRRMKDLGVSPPTKRSHWTTLTDWIATDVIPGIAREVKTYDMAIPDQRKEAEGWRRLADALSSFLASWRSGEPWVKEVDREVVLRPVLVDGFGQRGIWRHAGPVDKWLLMSATVISPGTMLRELGWDQDWQVVRVPSTFPVENRPIYNLPLARVTAKSEEHELERLAGGVKGVVDRHRRESVLVHTVSYRLTQRIVKALEGTGRHVHFYLRSEDRQAAVEAFSHDPGSIMVAPSLDRGVDFHGDLCRVMVIAKVPYPNMGDRRVAERLHADGGQSWFDVQTIRTLVQMTGRGVRSADDTAVTYILDSMFTTLHSKHRDVFPRWWTDAVSTPFQPLELLNANT